MAHFIFFCGLRWQWKIRVGNVLNGITISEPHVMVIENIPTVL